MEYSENLYTLVDEYHHKIEEIEKEYYERFYNESERLMREFRDADGKEEFAKKYGKEACV